MKEAIRILVIDDDEEDFMITRDLFSEIDPREYHLDWASSYAKGLEQITRNEHDLFLVDYRLGPDDGLQLIHEAQRIGAADAPYILLTGQNDIEIDRQAMKAGASDYLVKGNISPSSLERSVRYSIEQSRHLKEIKTLNADLEKKVSERTLFLEETILELKETKKELDVALSKEKELNELKSRFVSMASHEFRTPLATILSSLSLIKRYSEPVDQEKRSKHIIRIETAIRNLTELLNDFLSIGKLEEGKVMAVYESFNIKHFITTVTGEMQSITRPGQEIHYTHQGSEQIFLDPKILKNILNNLCSNAIKFSPDGGHIYLTSESEPTLVRITVKDNGIGIPDADQKNLFDRFFRAHNVS
ncbi:MAG TPA: hybrid sensor histidine kinase/response regulator, partial [Bacteroidia bacterium]|nr:hybrid sensor histidine kinase/response regulator [Bacteroidia bacterium]